MYISLFDID